MKKVVVLDSRWLEDTSTMDMVGRILSSKDNVVVVISTRDNMPAVFVYDIVSDKLYLCRDECNETHDPDILSVISRILGYSRKTIDVRELAKKISDIFTENRLPPRKVRVTVRSGILSIILYTSIKLARIGTTDLSYIKDRVRRVVGNGHDVEIVFNIVNNRVESIEVLIYRNKS